MRAGLFALALLVFLGAVGQPARAQVTPAQKAQAKKLFEQGEGHYQQGEHKKALAFYKRALAVWRHPAFLFNIAQCHRLLKHYEKSLFFYRLFLSAAPMAPNLAEVKQRIAEMKRQVDAQRLRLGRMGKLSVITRPPGAAIYVDRVKGKPVATSPAIFPIASGQHLVLIKKAGFLPITRKVDVATGKVALLDVSLTVDQSSVGPVYKTFYKRWWFWAGLGLGAAAAVTAGVAGGTALSMKAEWDDNRGVVDNPTDFKRRVKTLGVLADVMIGVGAVTAAAVLAGVIYVVIKRKKERQSGLRIWPGCGATGCGVWATGRF